ncbi:MAG: putative photosynthetic complex assembly protein PuhE [bacterium]
MAWLVALAIGFALFMWWFSTGAILLLVRRGRVTHTAAIAAMSVLVVLALIGLGATHGDRSVAGAFAGFCYGLIVWAWLEMTFLFGFITGPRTTPCPVPTSEWQRFRFAVETIAYHEIAILFAGIAVVALTWGAENQVGTFTFMVLWAMRVSAKLNIFYGAPHVTEEFLPPHLAYLGSYFRRGRVSRFFPVSVTVASLLFGMVVHSAASTSDQFDTISLTLVASLLGLAILEHWFLVLPIPDAALWKWAVRDKEGATDGLRPHAEAVSPVSKPSHATVARMR